MTACLVVVGAVAACSASDEATVEVGDGLLVRDTECLRFDAPDGKGSVCGDAVHGGEPWAAVVGRWAYGVAPADTAVVRTPEAEQSEFLGVEGGMAFAVQYDAGSPLTAVNDDGDVLFEFDLGAG